MARPKGMGSIELLDYEIRFEGLAYSIKLYMWWWLVCLRFFLVVYDAFCVRFSSIAIGSSVESMALAFAYITFSQTAINVLFPRVTCLLCSSTALTETRCVKGCHWRYGIGSSFFTVRNLTFPVRLISRFVWSGGGSLSNQVSLNDYYRKYALLPFLSPSLIFYFLFEFY